MSNLEQTLSIIKPDAVERNVENEIKEMFKSNGFSILKEKKIQIEKSEAEKFYKLRVKKDLSSNKVIGLSEIKEYLDKRIDLSELKEKISIKTRQYAKRQSTWARGQMSDWQKIKFDRVKSFIKKFPKSA